MRAAAEVERRDDVSPLHMLGDRRIEDRAIVPVVTLEERARDVNGDHDVRVRVTVGAVAQRDLVQRARGRGVRTGRSDSQHDECDSECDCREPETPGTHAPPSRVVLALDRLSPNLALQLPQCCQRAPTMHPVLPGPIRTRGEREVKVRVETLRRDCAKPNTRAARVGSPRARQTFASRMPTSSAA